jgi:hypothetical protein
MCIAYIGFSRYLWLKLSHDKLILMAPHPARLLTNRARTILALGLTALVFVQDIRGLRLGHAESGWFLGAPLLHDWTLVGVNALIYTYICWLAFWFIRRTAGRERAFVVGWFAGILLWPLSMLRPQWATVTRHVGAFGLTVALLAALALLLEPSGVAESGPGEPQGP